MLFVEIGHVLKLISRQRAMSTASAGNDIAVAEACQGVHLPRSIARDAFISFIVRTRRKRPAAASTALQPILCLAAVNCGNLALTEADVYNAVPHSMGDSLS